MATAPGAVPASTRPARFLRIVVDTPPHDADARHFDRMRRARNQMHYEARPVSSADADKAEPTAPAVLTAATMPKDKP